MKRLIAAALLAGSTLLVGCVPPQQMMQPVSVTPSRGPVCDTSFRIVNNSSRAVAQLFFSHSSINAWGNDQLGSAVLPPGRTMNYRAANPGAYDFRVVWAGGGTAELRRVNVCTATEITVTNAGLRAI